MKEYLYKNNCIICSKPFNTNNIKRVYCGQCTNTKEPRIASFSKICFYCNIEYKSRTRRGRFCSVKCRSNFNQDVGTYKNYRKHSIENTLLSVLWGARSRAKKRGMSCTVTDPEIIQLLRKQNNKCAMTGIEMLPSIQEGCKKKHPFTVSIDRINSNEGYDLNNIQLVCTICNTFKNNYSMEDIEQVCVNYIKYNKIKID